jgi:hypothetical protein
MAERKREASRLSDADLQSMVGGLFTQNDPHRANFHGLLYAGDRAVPFLIKAVNEPRTWTAVFFHEGFDLYGASPFERICELLHNTAPAGAVSSVARYLKHPDPSFRRQAAWLIGGIGTSRCVTPLTVALADTELEVREYALIGIMNGLSANRRNEVFLRGMFPVIVSLLAAGTYEPQGPAEIVGAIDITRAVPILESPQCFNVDNPQLSQVLAALDRENVKVPRAILAPLLRQTELLAVKDKRRESDYGAALILYARNPDLQAKSRFQALIRSPSFAIRCAASRGLEILAGINPAETAW